jgi:PAS domain S-box-containing protein
LEERVRQRTAELEAAYEDLQASEDKYRQLFATETDAIVLKDGHTFQFIDANESACRLFGYTREQLLRITQVDASAEPEATRRALRKSAREGRIFVPLRYLKKKDGTVFPAEISSCSFTLRGRRVICGAIRDITDRKRAEEALQAAHAKLLAAREEERRRLSRELHDSIGQRLVAAHLKLRNAAEIPSVARDPLFSGLLRDLLVQLGGLSHEVRDVSHALYPQTLEMLGLPAALRQLAKDMGSTQPSVKVRCDAAAGDDRLSPETEIALYRIAQEALSNAIRHARCRRVDVRFRCSGAQVSLTIADDGRGFNPAKAANKGVGLASMRERAESIGAAFELTSKPGRTCVRVRAAAPKEA